MGGFKRRANYFRRRAKYEREVEMNSPVLTKYLVYETFLPVRQFRAVEASGLHGHMEGIAPESRVYSWWARDAEDAIDMVNKFLEGR